MLHCELELSVCYGHAASLVWMQQSLGVTSAIIIRIRGHPMLQALLANYF